MAILFQKKLTSVCACARARERKKNNEMVFGSLPIREVGNNRVDVGSYPQHLSLHRTYGSRIRRYIHIGERKL